MIDNSRSIALHDRAKSIFPTGVNSGIRAERPVPLTFAHAAGSRMTDVDGNVYIDYTMGQGALLLGHADPDWVAAVSDQAARGSHYAAQSEVELRVGERLTGAIASVEMLRFTSSATEAVQAALRLARAATGRRRILRFEGHYHGWSDEGLAGFAPRPEDYIDDHSSIPRHASTGVVGEAVEQFVVGRWNDPEGLRKILAEHGDDLAAVIFEPVMCNTGCIEPKGEFLDVLCDEPRARGALLICDETITSLRHGTAGAQHRFGLHPDITIMGKALGGGVPIAAFGGSTRLFRLIDGDGPVRHGGTLNANPLCLAAVNHMLDRVSDDAIADMEALAAQLETGLRTLATEARIPLLVQRSVGVVHTAVTPLRRFNDYREVVATSDGERWDRIRLGLLDEGIRVVGRGLWYLSLAHTAQDIRETLAAASRAFRLDNAK